MQVANWNRFNSYWVMSQSRRPRNISGASSGSVRPSTIKSGLNLGPSWINQIHRDDAASAIFLLANNGSALAGQIFNVTDDEPILQSECYRWLAQKLKRPLPAAMAPDSERKRGRSNKRVSNEKLRDTGWSPIFPTFADAMEKSILVGAIHPN